MKKRGFTLIELLVVISIIAILMAVMVPALRRARAQAQSIVCSSQLKDLGTAMQMYVTENNGNLPDSQNVGPNGEILAGNRWLEKLSKYYNRSTRYEDISLGKDGTIYDYNLYRCPTQHRLAEKYKDEDNNVSAGASGTYGYNVYFTNYLNQKKFNWRKFSSIIRPGNLPLMADLSMENTLNDGDNTRGGWLLLPYYPHPNAITQYGWSGNLQRKEYSYFGAAPNHDGRTNYLFADGHCESLGLCPWRDHKGTDFHPVRNVNVNP